MSSAQPLEIKVIYGGGSGRRSIPARPARRNAASVPVRQSARRGGWLLLGLLNIAIAAGLCYATWWPIDREIFVRIMTRSPLPPEAINAFLGGAPPESAWISEGIVPAKQRGNVAANEVGTTPAAAPESAEARTKRIGAVFYAWLGLSTIGYCGLGLAAGAAWSKSLGGRGHGYWIILATGVLLALVAAGAVIWMRYGVAYPPDHLRFGMAGLLILALLMGLCIRTGPRFLNRFAGAVVILSALGSVVALKLLGDWGVMEPAQSSVLFLVMVFAVHSIYGWLLLLPLTSRLGRA